MTTAETAWLCPKCPNRVPSEAWVGGRPVCVCGYIMRPAPPAEAAPPTCSEEGHGEYGKTCFHAAAAPDAEAAEAPEGDLATPFFDEWIKTPEAQKVILGCPPRFAEVIHSLRAERDRLAKERPTREEYTAKAIEALNQKERADRAESALSEARAREKALREAIGRIGDGMLRAAGCSDDPADMLRAYANDLGAALAAGGDRT